MGIALDTVLTSVANPGANYTATAAATGDSLTVRNFATTSSAMLESIIRQGAASGAVRVRSPLFADDTQGIRFYSAETPTVYLLPPQVGEPLRAGDELTVEVTGGTAETDLAVLVNYYADLPGAAPRLYDWSSINGNVAHIKPVVVAVTTNATIGQWEDTAITTTENLLHADTDYAVLGFVTDSALAVIGIKGSETNNFRICGPGTTATDDTSRWFIDQSNYHGTPHIPVFNSNNRDNVYVSTAADTASATANVTMVLAQLKNKLA